MIKKYKFTRAVLDENLETFVGHVSAFEGSQLTMPIYLSLAFLLAALQQDQALNKIPLDYLNYVDIFSADLAIKLTEITGINEYAIKLVKAKQSLYKPIYSLSLIELEMLKTYIKIHLKTKFI